MTESFIVRNLLRTIEYNEIYSDGYPNVLQHSTLVNLQANNLLRLSPQTVRKIPSYPTLLIRHIVVFMFN